MKKIFNILLLTIIVSMIKIGVKAETFYEDNYLDNIYVTYQNSTIYKPQHMRYIRRKSDNKPVYCLTPSKLLYYDENYNINNNYNISPSKLKRVSQIAYFGYGYKNHNSDKWYAITQVMIWKEMDSNHISFNDSYKGNDIVRFTEEENEINNLIDNYNKSISLNDIKIKYNDSYTISNDSFSNYNISSDLDIINNNNSIIINGNKKGDFKVNLISKDGDYPTKTNIYTAVKGQDILVRGSIDRQSYFFNVNVSLGTLVLHKMSSDMKNDLSLEGAKYDIYDINDNYITSTELKEDGYSYIELKYGDYYAVETEAPYGYEIDKEKHYFKIDRDNVYVDLLEEKTKVDLNIHKKLENNESEANITFDIYKDGSKVDSFITDNDGNINTKLTYGNYTIKQITTTKYYDLLDDINISVDKKESINLDLTNHLINSKLIIKKIDSDTKEFIDYPTTFKIKDLINNNYIGDFTTLNGTISLDIKAGLYRLYEINEPLGYIKTNPIDFEVLDSNPVILNVYNKKIVKKKEKNIEDLTIPIIKEDKKIISNQEDNKEIKTIYPKTSHIKESIFVSIIYILFILGMYLYAKHKEK